MAFIATPESLAAYGITPMRPLRLSAKYFWRMVAAAAVLHWLVLMVFEWMPDSAPPSAQSRPITLTLTGAPRADGRMLNPISGLEVVEVSEKPVKAAAVQARAPIPASKPMNLNQQPLPQRSAKPLAPAIPKPTPVAALAQPSPAKPQEQKRIKIDGNLENQPSIPAATDVKVPAPRPKLPPKVEQTAAAPVAAVTESKDLPPPSAAVSETASAMPEVAPVIATQSVRQQRLLIRPNTNSGVSASGGSKSTSLTPMNIESSQDVHGLIFGEPQGREAIEKMRTRYEQELSKWLAEHKQYPTAARALGQHGKPVLRLQIDRKGQIKSSKIEKSSGYRLLDDAALKMAQNSSPYPAPPKHYPGELILEFLIPISFDLK